MTHYVPTKHTVSSLERLGLTWPEFVRDVDGCGLIQPMPGHETRQCHFGTRVQAFIEPGVYDGEPCFYVVGVRLRVSEGPALPASQQIVGRETRAVKSRKRGGSGRMWPTSWQELEKLIESHEGMRVLQGNGGHRIVYKNGKQIDVLPTSSSDHRALHNACLQLRRKGIDVRRRVGKVAA